MQFDCFVKYVINVCVRQLLNVITVMKKGRDHFKVNVLLPKHPVNLEWSN